MIQIDMQMPKSCSECCFAEHDLSCGIIALSDMCQQNDKMYSAKETAKPEYCPLKEVKQDKQYVAANMVVETTDKNTHEVILSTSCKPEPLYTAWHYEKDLVRCKDCKWYSEKGFCKHPNGGAGNIRPANWFCADGKRKNY